MDPRSTYSFLSKALLYLLLLAQFGIHVDMIITDDSLQNMEKMELCAEDGESEEECKEEKEKKEVSFVYLTLGGNDLIMFTQQRSNHLMSNYHMDVVTPPPENV